jgi:hypothetical protein
MGVVIEICTKYPGGPTRITVTDMFSREVCVFLLCIAKL